MVHELKILPQYFEKVLDGSKTFELRKDDRGFEVGDILILKEFRQGLIDCTQSEPIVIQERGYTGRKIEKEISYIFKGGIPGMGLRKGFSILGLKDIIANENYMENNNESSKEKQKRLNCTTAIGIDNWDCYKDCAFWDGKICTDYEEEVDK